jgi:hypothetical protein
MLETSFWSFHLGNIIELGVVVVAYAAYRGDQRKQGRERKEARETMLQEQATMHAQNTQRLETLSSFHATQLEVNNKRDMQISLLMQQTSSLTEIARGLDRRLEMIEDRGRP